MCLSILLIFIVIGRVGFFLVFGIWITCECAFRSVRSFYFGELRLLI